MSENDDNNENKSDFFNSKSRKRSVSVAEAPSSSGRFGLKRDYQSGSLKRKIKDVKKAKSVENTKSLDSYFGKNGQGSSSSASFDVVSVDNSIGGIPLSERNDNEDENANNDSGGDLVCDDECFSSNTVPERTAETVHLDFTQKYPTDRGMLPRDVNDDLKREIIGHGPCRPKCEVNFVNEHGKANFFPSYYYRRQDNIEVSRQWLCYSPSLQKPYCETCWLFVERDVVQNSKT